MSEEKRELVVNDRRHVAADAGEQPPATTPMEMLSRALSSGASPETLEKLMQLQERWQDRSAKAAYDADMAAMQGDLPVIEKRRTGNNWKYADWGDIKLQINPILQKHGFAITHRIQAHEKELVVTAICSHRGGHREETSLPLPYDTTGSKNAVQARGSTVQYGIRYTGCAIAGIAISGEDKDGVEADDYDTSEWTAKIAAADEAHDKGTLLAIQKELKGKRTEIPDGAWKILSSAWSAALKRAEATKNV